MPIFLIVLVGLIAATTTNPMLTLVSLAAFGFIWIRAFASPIRTTMAAFASIQWLQITMQVWLADLFRIDLSVPQVATVCDTCRPLHAMIVTAATEETTILALAGITLLVLGARLLEPRVSSLQLSVTELQPSRLFLGYLMLLVVDRLSSPYTGGGLAQPLIALGSLKFAFAILLLYVWVTTRRGMIPLFSVIAIEIIVGFTSYFGNFKTIFIVAGVASLTIAKIYRKQTLQIAIVAVPVLLILVAVWTAIKPTYRFFLSQGARNQTVTVDMGASLGAVQKMSGDLDADNMIDGMLGSALRISYIEIPSYVMMRVPAILPYQYGALWGRALYQVIIPRLLFPDKPILLSDSVLTSRYTGIRYDTLRSSVSMGYLIESYIDFGILGALIIPFALGMFYALIARHILALGGRYDYGFCIAVLIVLFLPVQLFEISNIKLFPGILWNWIVCGIVVRVFWPRVRPWFASGLRNNKVSADLAR
jgi:hypothetical protein